MVIKNKQKLSFSKLEISIIFYLFKNFQKKLTIRELAKELESNHVQVSILLKKLEQKNLVLFENLANSKIYRFNFNSDNAINFMSYLLSIDLLNLPDELAILNEELKKFQKSLIFGLIFGSSIHTTDFNDVDILLVYEKKYKNKILKIKKEILTLDLLRKPIRFIDITKEDLELNFKENNIFREILGDNLVFTGFLQFSQFINILQLKFK